MEPAGPKLEAINKLKNTISAKVNDANYFPYICNIHGYQSPSNWFKNKDSDKYKHDLSTRLSSTLKSLLNIPANLSSSASSYSTSPLQVALREHATHQRYMQDISPKKWIERSDIDKKLNSIIEQGLTKSVFAQIYGPPGCGKTAVICRLLELLENQNCYVIARFSYLTDCSLFINELLRNILLKLCEMSKTSMSQIIVSFHLSEILAHYKAFIEKADKPVFLLIDDVHVLKFGKTLCSMEKPLRKLFPKLSFIFTSIQSASSLSCFPQPEVFELPILTRDQIIEILKSQGADNHPTLGSEQLGLIRQKVGI